MGTWLLAAYGPGVGLAAMAELRPAAFRRTLPGRMLQLLSRPAGLSGAVIAPGVVSYTAVLLSQTAVPAWHEAHSQLPFVFAGSAAASAGGLGMVGNGHDGYGQAARNSLRGRRCCCHPAMGDAARGPCRRQLHVRTGYQNCQCRYFSYPE